MALPMLVGGADCGPSNPLQGLSKRFDSDRGLQQDFFGPGRAGSSQEVFRSQPAGPLQHDQDVAQFFAKSPPPQFSSSNAYDLGALRGSLPTSGTQQLKQGAVVDWAADFLTTQQSLHQANPQSTSNSVHVTQAANVTRPAEVMPWSNGVPTWGMGMGMRSVPSFAPLNVVSPQSQKPQISWDKEFDAQAIEPVQQQQIAGPSDTQRETSQPQDQDELARTAGLLLETVKSEQNPKFQNSQFMNLMMQLRDHKVVVRGNEMVENDETVTAANLKGKGKASDLPMVEGRREWPPVMSEINHGSFSVGNTAAAGGTLSGEQNGIQEDANDAYFRQDNVDYMQYWNNVDALKGVSTGEMESGWDKLQDDWDKFETLTKGINPVPLYQFQTHNPYTRGDGVRTLHHTKHSDERLETVLELEAAVQRNMSDASAWYELGVKQQEHERELQALQALTRAVELDPSYLPGWLALAVSYTNDGRRLEAYDAVRQWVMRNDNHRNTLDPHLSQYPEPENATVQEKFNHLVRCLINIAQQSAVGQIDADIQIALAVLFNSNEDYEKAQDCFRAALAVRPDDWQLYNRVGATMANSGRAEEALEFYYRALDLNPVYIRARYNLGISCINLKRYNEGSQHILDALSLQDAEGVHDAGGVNDARGGITSSALWESLKTACLHMQRIDLATLCDKRDLEAFRFNYQFQ